MGATTVQSKFKQEVTVMEVYHGQFRYVTIQIVKKKLNYTVRQGEAGFLCKFSKTTPHHISDFSAWTSDMK